MTTTSPAPAGRSFRQGWLPPLLGLAFLPAPAAAQHLYMPRTFKQAVAKGTRTLSGEPGPRYWENHARYRITVSAMPPDRQITGSEEIVYRNDSPDTLPSLVIKLFENFHRPTAARGGATSPDFLTSGTHIDRFAVNGQPQEWKESGRSVTWQSVKLPQPLAPHDSVRLAFDWHYDVSKRAGREGMLDSTTYFLAYFYPRVAVYDDVDGWDTMEHTGHEFYSDFNDYDVTVRVPANYVVWGTGMLGDAAAVLQPEPLARYRSSLTADGTIHVATGAQLAGGQVTKPDSVNAWRFESRYVPDVAFALSNHYDWDAGSVLVDEAAHRRASVQAAYDDSAEDFHYMVGFGEHALDWFSHNWPGVPYPYPKSTIVQGSADMEYPMMVNDGSVPDTSFSRFVADHEIAHTYMPFYMGIDETRYAFMDEGWATTFEYLINSADMGLPKATSLFRSFRVNRWIHNPSPLSDLPIVTPADVLGGVAYGDNAYGKAALGYLAMKDLLGDRLFKQCLRAYIARWNGKHPQPWDFFYTFDGVASRGLDWFWRDWFFSNGYIDLAVRGVKKTSGGYTVSLENVGGMPAPVNLVLTYGDGTTETVHETPAIWAPDQAKATVTVHTGKTLQSLTLDGGIWMDADTSNDRWTVKY